jgi:general secretion pathway protein H
VSPARLPRNVQRFGRPQCRGFTLLELLLVLLLLGLVYGLAGPMLGSGSSGLEMKGATRQLAAGLRKARSIAITERREAALTIDVDARTFLVTGDPRIYALPRRVELGLFTAQSELVQQKIGNIRFFPDGSSTGGRLTISAAEAKQTVDVDWMTGRVVVE